MTFATVAMPSPAADRRDVSCTAARPSDLRFAGDPRGCCPTIRPAFSTCLKLPFVGRGANSLPIQGSIITLATTRRRRSRSPAVAVVRGEQGCKPLDRPQGFRKPIKPALFVGRFRTRGRASAGKRDQRQDHHGTRPSCRTREKSDLQTWHERTGTNTVAIDSEVAITANWISPHAASARHPRLAACMCRQMLSSTTIGVMIMPTEMVRASTSFSVKPIASMNASVATMVWESSATTVRVTARTAIPPARPAPPQQPQARSRSITTSSCPAPPAVQPSGVRCESRRATLHLLGDADCWPDCWRTATKRPAARSAGPCASSSGRLRRGLAQSHDAVRLDTTTVGTVRPPPPGRGS